MDEFISTKFHILYKIQSHFDDQFSQKHQVFFLSVSWCRKSFEKKNEYVFNLEWSTDVALIWVEIFTFSEKEKQFSIAVKHQSREKKHNWMNTNRQNDAKGLPISLSLSLLQREILRIKSFGCDINQKIGSDIQFDAVKIARANGNWMNVSPLPWLL